MKEFLTLLSSTLLTVILTAGSCSDKPSDPESGKEKPVTPAETAGTPGANLRRAITLADAAFDNYFEGSKMSRYYNPYSGSRSSETGSIWMYTSAIEATVAILEALQLQKEAGESSLHEQKFAHFSTQLDKLYEGAQFYKGTLTLTSYTQTATWHPYAVNRGEGPGTADVSGVLNVYDDQMWLVRELIGAWKVTGQSRFLTEAESLTAYVMDGWDTTLDAAGQENGGIPWGPGYVTKHACSNGPMVSPLVALAEIYAGKDDTVTFGIVNPDGTRSKKTMRKADAYLEWAVKVYRWQKSHLLRPDGVYDDMMGGYRSGGGKPEYETVDGQQYRKHTPLYDRVGPAFSYNSGTMLSGAADLYRVTKDTQYLDDLKALTDKSFGYFAKLGTVKQGLYTYDISGFNNWFNGVLMRGYAAAYPAYSGAQKPLKSFQDNLDYSWENYLYKDMLPSSLLAGWNVDRSRNNVEGMFTFAFAAEYAVLAKHLIENKQ